MEDDIGKQWESNAEAYAELIGDEGTPHHQSILNPCVEGMLGQVKGKKLLDAGCGEGYLSRHYARRGAIVTGIDVSAKLIEICREHPDQDSLGIDYRIGDICGLDGVSEEEFDQVLCNLVLLNSPCLREAFQSFYRVLNPGGILVFSIAHPAFNFYGPGAWEMGPKDPDTQRRKGLFFKVDQYFNEKVYERYWKTRNGEKFPQPIIFFHRTISTYVNTLVEVGFQITSIEEPQPISRESFFNREKRIPFFLVFRAEKPNRGKT
ncbi:MAG: class I SAM-dependent methyltransferase [Candidatus Thorarchaeota archaeon]